MLFGLQESREEESSRVVKIRSKRRRNMTVTRTGVDSRKFDKWVLHGDLLLFMTWFCFLGLRNLCHFCLLYQFLIRVCMEYSSCDSIMLMEVGDDDGLVGGFVVWI